ncbi:hypothetical protein LXL04_025539 [Taraxacum kok-saghyz]
MSPRSKAWMVAGTVGLVEALKDQGFARWTYTIRTIHHHAKSNLRSLSYTKNFSEPAAMASSRAMEEKAKESEESKAWMVAGTVGLVEALKDQGFARWTYTIRNIHHHAKSNLRSLSYTKNLSEPAAMATSRAMEEKAKQSEESKAWMVAGTVGLVEALKDQGFARWTYTIRTIHHHAKSNLRSLSHTKNLSEPAAMASSRAMEEKAKQSEESLRKVMFCTMELHHPGTPPPRQVQSPINFPDQEAVFAGSHGFSRRHRRESEAIRGVIEKSHVLELLGP